MQEFLDAARDVVLLPWQNIGTPWLRWVSLVASVLAFILVLGGVSHLLGEGAARGWRLFVSSVVSLGVIVAAAAATQLWIAPNVSAVSENVTIAAVVIVLSMVVTVPLVSVLHKARYGAALVSLMLATAAAWGASVLLQSAFNAASSATGEVGGARKTRRGQLEEVMQR